MDRARSVHILFGANLLAAAFVVAFLVLKAPLDAAGSPDPGTTARSTPATGTAEEGRGGRTAGGGDAPAGSGGRLTGEIPGARGPAEDQGLPSGVVPVRGPDPSLLPPDATPVPEPPPLPEDTRERIRGTGRVIRELCLAVELYRSRHDEYPPSVLEDGNRVNAGIESLLVHLRYSGLATVRDDDWIGNTDGDRFPDGFRLLGRGTEGAERREILDAWGNPLVYVRHDRYGESATCRIGGEDSVVTPRISRRTGEHHARDFVQIWSAGPNGVNEDGGGDDVTSWHIRE